MIANRLTELSPQLLQQRDIQLVMLDFDNTIVPYTTNEPTEEMETWLRQMADSEFTLCVVSNSRKDRVKKFCAKYGIDCITHARKPFSKGIRQCLDRYGVPAANAVLVGDQIYTDTLGGNLCGVQTLLVKAIHNHNFWLKARHVLEKPWIYAARKRRIHNEEY
jgi:HAD superfamily phosphatase (TIGR01668 family)